MDYNKLANGKRKITAIPFKKILSLLLSVSVLFTTLPHITLTARAADGGNSTNPTIINASIGAAMLTSGYYELQGTFENIGRLTVSGDVHLILNDNANVTITGGINVAMYNSLTIDGNTGSLTATGTGERHTGIGSTIYSKRRHTINGGTVTANGNGYSPGIGTAADSTGTATSRLPAARLQPQAEPPVSAAAAAVPARTATTAPTT
jgi:hypothetical protein